MKADFIFHFISSIFKVTELERLRIKYLSLESILSLHSNHRQYNGWKRKQYKFQLYVQYFSLSKCGSKDIHLEYLPTHILASEHQIIKLFVSIPHN